MPNMVIGRPKLQWGQRGRCLLRDFRLVRRYGPKLVFLGQLNQRPVGRLVKNHLQRQPTTMGSLRSQILRARWNHQLYLQDSMTKYNRRVPTLPDD